jgi:hypothetical protein
MESQKDVFTTVMEDVFLDPNFTHIEKPVLYRVYELMIARDGGYAKSAKNFHADVSNWMRNNNVYAEAVKINVKISPQKGGSASKTTAYVYTTKLHGVERNNNQYIVWDEDRRKDVLVDRNVALADVVLR